MRSLNAFNSMIMCVECKRYRQQEIYSISYFNLFNIDVFFVWISRTGQL